NELVANERVGTDVGYRIDGDTLQEPAQHTHPHLYHALRVEQSGQSNVAHFADPDSVQADFGTGRETSGIGHVACEDCSGSEEIGSTTRQQEHQVSCQTGGCSDDTQHSSVHG